MSVRSAELAAYRSTTGPASSGRVLPRAGHLSAQAEIARRIGRSQPEVSRLLHFHGTSPRAMALRRNRDVVRRLVRDAGGRNVRVFGSVATGTDHDGSDIDLLFYDGQGR
jgi:hypothetical protein